MLVLNRLRIDELRKAHGITTDTELARVIGVDRSTLQRVYNGATLPSNGFMAKVRAAFPAAMFDELFILRDAS